MVTFTYKPPPPKKNIFSSYPLKPNSHADNSLAAIPSEVLTNPLPPPLPKNNIAYNISKLLIKLKTKKQKQTTNTLTRSILSSWQMVDVSKPFFPPQNLVPIARGSCDVIRMECEKSGFLIGPFVPRDRHLFTTNHSHILNFLWTPTCQQRSNHLSYIVPTCGLRLSPLQWT